MPKKKRIRPKFNTAKKANFKTVTADYDNDRIRLCLDLADRTGFAVMDNGKLIDRGSYKSVSNSLTTLASIGTAGLFNLFMETHRREVFEFYGDEVDEVCIEFADFQKGQNARYFTINYTVIALLCEEYKLPMTMVYVSDIKMMLGVNKMSDKSQVVDGINAIFKLGLSKEDHDIADAIGIGLCAHTQGKLKSLHYAP